MRYILRNAYDGDYEQAIKRLVNVIEKQEETIKKQENKLVSLEKRVVELEKINKLTKELVINPTLEASVEETNLTNMLSDFQNKNS